MADVDGEWNTVIKAPTGEQKTKLRVVSAGDAFTGEFTGPDGTVEITDGKVEGSSLSWNMAITKPMPLTLAVKTTVEGDAMTGSVAVGAFGSFPFTGKRA